ncbi:hypothetical protein [Actinoplanes sp. NPDC049265]|uniref:hypothetical protein n=1 Tax=Actinoplanes sp. NPDC049265 TaxID=3363902 RepID=UPI003715D889
MVGALRGSAGAALLVGDAASRVEVGLAEMPGMLYRVTTPGDSGLTPDVTVQRGVYRLALRPTAGTGPDIVRIILNRRVRWDVRLPAGAGEQRLDLSAGRVTRVELGPSGLVELSLPRPWGTVPVLLRSGAGTVEMSTPQATKVRITLPDGAGVVTTPWTNSTDTPAATTLTAPGWARTRDRYTIRLTSGVGSFTVRERDS